MFNFGDIGDRYYFILSGSVSVHTPMVEKDKDSEDEEEENEEGEEKEDDEEEEKPKELVLVIRAVLRKGASFGDYALITD